jgi:hypothetical protein
MIIYNVSLSLSQSHTTGYHRILPLPFTCSRGIFLVSKRKPGADFVKRFPAIWFSYTVLYTWCLTLSSASAPTLRRILRKLFSSSHVVPHWKRGNSSNSGTWDVTQVTHHSTVSKPQGLTPFLCIDFYYIWDRKFRHSPKTAAKIWSSYLYFLLR